MSDFHDELEALADKHGLVDFYFCGVDLMGGDMTLTRIGAPKADQANRQRYLHMAGLMQEGLSNLLSDRYALRKSKQEEP